MIALLLARVASAKWIMVGVALGGLLIAYGVQTKRLAWAQTEIVQVRNAWAADRSRADAEALRVATEYRAEEQRRAAAHQEIVDDTERKLVAARADAAIADAAAGKLRGRVAVLVAEARAATGHPAAADGGAPATDPVGMLADVLGRADDRARLLADYADRARLAGQACVDAYEALTRP